MEYDRAIKTALLNWISGIAQSIIIYGVGGGFDAWREFYNRYVPMAGDPQIILKRKFMGLKLVNEANVDDLFQEVERIREPYARAGSQDGGLFEKWVVVVVLQNPLKLFLNFYLQDYDKLLQWSTYKIRQ